MATTVEKLALIQKSRWWKIALWSAIVVAAALLTLVIVQQVKKAKQNKIVEEEKNKLVENKGPVAPPAQNNSQNTAPPKTTGSANNPIGYPKPQDEFPLVKGSQGQNVKALQVLINQITGKATTNQRGIFDDQTYNALLSVVGSKYYPVTPENFGYINLLASQKIAGNAYMPTANFTGSHSGGGNNLQIGGRSCVKQWDTASGQYVWNCGGGYVYNTHGQPI